MKCSNSQSCAPINEINDFVDTSMIIQRDLYDYVDFEIKGKRPTKKNSDSSKFYLDSKRLLTNFIELKMNSISSNENYVLPDGWATNRYSLLE